MNKIINKFSMAGYHFMPKLHLKQPRVTCEIFTNDCERILKNRQTGNLKHLYRNELDKS